MRKRVLLAGMVLALFAVACGADDPTLGGGGDEQVPGVDADVTVTAAETELGTVLADADGFTLYIFTNDEGSTSSCYDSCAETWPPLVIDGSPVAGDGVGFEPLGTTQRDDGATQVTFNGRPLYRFAGDANPGDTTGQGVGDIWFVVDAASGEPIES